MRGRDSAAHSNLFLEKINNNSSGKGASLLQRWEAVGLTCGASGVALKSVGLERIRDEESGVQSWYSA